MRSTTCRGSNNQFLEEYHSLVAAEMAVEETKARYGHTLTPAKCRACGYWHLTTVATRRQCMFCTDRALFLKDIYSTREEAQRTAEHLRKEKKVQLLPYKCPHGSGWHLTKKWAVGSFQSAVLSRYVLKLHYSIPNQNVQTGHILSVHSDFPSFINHQTPDA